LFADTLSIAILVVLLPVFDGALDCDPGGLVAGIYLGFSDKTG
jgi:hypothetical protein